MKKYILLVLLLVIGLVAVSTAQVSMPCGPGVLLRAEGSIIIDSYTIFPNPSMTPASGAGLISPSPFNEMQLKQGPTAITLGKTLANDTRVCIEEVNGSKCVPLSVIRALK